MPNPPKSNSQTAKTQTGKTQTATTPTPDALGPGPFPVTRPLRVAGLSARQPTPFGLAPGAAERDALAAALGIARIPALRFEGRIAASGARDFVLTGRLTARVVQRCVVTLEPVTTDVAEEVVRRYLAEWSEPEADEREIPEDDTAEPLGAVIDPAAVMAEALALALPEYPRAPGVALGEAASAPPGVAPLRDADVRPFAGLADLARRMGGPSDPEDGTG